MILGENASIISCIFLPRLSEIFCVDSLNGVLTYGKTPRTRVNPFAHLFLSIACTIPKGTLNCVAKLESSAACGLFVPRNLENIFLTPPNSLVIARPPDCATISSFIVSLAEPSCDPSRLMSGVSSCSGSFCRNFIKPSSVSKVKLAIPEPKTPPGAMPLVPASLYPAASPTKAPPIARVCLSVGSPAILLNPVNPVSPLGPSAINGSSAVVDIFLRSAGVAVSSYTWGSWYF